MTTEKLIQSKRRGHAAKVLQQMSKNLGPESFSSSAKVEASQEKMPSKSAMKNQVDLIRKDLVRLRHDLSRGYEMARKYLDKLQPKSLVKDLLKTK